ncbi:hypothetical protein CVT26_001793 [Gymnopilus dilepis]|uniref:Uncharacterized protein n=1 Tax=Gymnopilus dilepis TaxID=231916 RepID=A0A409VTD2_9AGAR|nr:hypothetical protein CVT26_001793 [Gymnopilus dilepis]
MSELEGVKAPGAARPHVYAASISSPNHAVPPSGIFDLHLLFVHGFFQLFVRFATAVSENGDDRRNHPRAFAYSRHMSPSSSLLQEGSRITLLKRFVRGSFYFVDWHVYTNAEPLILYSVEVLGRKSRVMHTVSFAVLKDILNHAPLLFLSLCSQASNGGTSGTR